ARYAWLAWLAGIRRRAGFGFSWAQRLGLNEGPYTKPHRGGGSWVYPEATEFARAHGFVDAPVVPRIDPPASLRARLARELAHLPEPRIALVIGTSEPRKDWGAANFTALARALCERGFGVLVLGGPAEAEAARRIAADSAGGAAVAAVCRDSVLESAAALAGCTLCVGNDTGALNLAAAVGARCLGFFGGTRPLRHDPRIEAIEAPSMQAIAPEDVLHAIDANGVPTAFEEGRAAACAHPDRAHVGHRRRRLRVAARRGAAPHLAAGAHRVGRGAGNRCAGRRRSRARRMHRLAEEAVGVVAARRAMDRAGTRDPRLSRAAARGPFRSGARSARPRQERVPRVAERGAAAHRPGRARRQRASRHRGRAARRRSRANLVGVPASRTPPAARLRRVPAAPARARRRGRGRIAVAARARARARALRGVRRLHHPAAEALVRRRVARARPPASRTHRTRAGAARRPRRPVSRRRARTG